MKIGQKAIRAPASGGEAENSAVRLSQVVELRRRYSRSVNLDRDLDSSGSLRGYVLTRRAADALERIVKAIGNPSTNHAFTLTGVYGTGKSAFAHFVASLLGPRNSTVRGEISETLKRASWSEKEIRSLWSGLPARGLIRAVSTARREPITSAVLRALLRGVEDGALRKKPQVEAIRRELIRQSRALGTGKPGQLQIAPLVAELADVCGQGVLLIVDELGKTLEFAGHATEADIYLLQELAELRSSPKGYPLVVVGLLHQTFGEYGSHLSAVERNEWQKIQGRFEDIAFLDAPEEMLDLVRDAVVHSPRSQSFDASVSVLAETWHRHFRKNTAEPYFQDVLTVSALKAIAPLHPISALALPILCARYAQHDRSLFSFLTSNEPHAFARFLNENYCSAETIPLQKLTDLYDYFVDVAGHGLAHRPQFQRWAEVNGIVRDARGLDDEARAVLKTVGVLNLLGTSGPLRASRWLICASLSNDPGEAHDSRWAHHLESLARRGLLTYRDKLDEYRIWEGTDFDIDAAVRQHAPATSKSLDELLSGLVPLPPAVAQRHSYETGTLRFFERRFASQIDDEKGAECEASDSDGLLLYWVGDDLPSPPPSRTSDGRPVVIVAGTGGTALRTKASDLSALRSVGRLPAVQSDGVARREIAARLQLSEADLSRAVRSVFDLSVNVVWINGRAEKHSGASLGPRLSDLCDDVYNLGPRLWNEHINRRELTSAGARARRELISMMLTKNEDRLGIVGDGPEASIYETVLRLTGIHRKGPGGWVFARPSETGLQTLWDVIESFCIEAKSAPRSAEELFSLLDRPPYGAKRGLVPLILAAVLLSRSDDVSVYFSGSFVPVLGPEHFELLVKQPSLFAVKSFELSGVRSQVFAELEEVVRQRGALVRQVKTGLRNSTLLSVVRPLVQFVVRLPEYTSRTKKLTQPAQVVRDALRTVREPDRLLFQVLPEALGIGSLETSTTLATKVALEYRKRLAAVLREIDGTYDRLLERCGELINDAFGDPAERALLRRDLYLRARHLAGRVIDPRMNALVTAMLNESASDREWLEAITMIIADKPAMAWTDDDELAFELRLSDAARRFGHLWSLAYESQANGHDSIEARRLSITFGDGREEHCVVWIEPTARDTIRHIVEDVVRHVGAFKREERLAVATAITEAMFALPKSEDHAARPIRTESDKPTRSPRRPRRA